MSTIKIHTASGEKIYFHDVEDARIDEVSGMIKIKQKHYEYSSEVWVMRENITCLHSFITEIDALYFEPTPQEKERPKNNDRQKYSVISMFVSIACLVAVVLMAII